LIYIKTELFRRIARPAHPKEDRIIVVQAFKALLEPGRPTALPRTHYWQIFV